MSPPKFALSLLPLGDRTWASFCLDWSLHFLELKKLGLQNWDSHLCAQDPSGVSVLPAERTRQHPCRRAEPEPALPRIVAENTRGAERPGANAKQRLRSATSCARLPGESVSDPQAHTRACQGTVIDSMLSERRHSALTRRWCPHLPRTGDPPERAGAQGERRRTCGGPPWQQPTRWVPVPAQTQTLSSRADPPDKGTCWLRFRADGTPRLARVEDPGLVATLPGGSSWSLTGEGRSCSGGRRAAHNAHLGAQSSSHPLSVTGGALLPGWRKDGGRQATALARLPSLSPPLLPPLLRPPCGAGTH